LLFTTAEKLVVLKVSEEMVKLTKEVIENVGLKIKGKQPIFLSISNQIQPLSSLLG
jgi:hypothetical protein